MFDERALSGRSLVEIWLAMVYCPFKCPVSHVQLFVVRACRDKRLATRSHVSRADMAVKLWKAKSARRQKELKTETMHRRRKKVIRGRGTEEQDYDVL